ncbi:hypothetical protein H072_6917 [Dactylellina haptotyla CBS 200.50]|uniref:Uncharacterized protein n=1 Tax=Dactylellina haptotyla (strain CBS 200.50) TaxID=1284197 RepID=S8A8V4_DACHA|nr:hypothetical protein H072_6917 [Dactylellina haptotyla CBS 200.50]
MSDRCSDTQKISYLVGWSESGYMVKLFVYALEELRYQRAVGDYLGNDWKSSSISQRIIDNFSRLADLHRGGSYFPEEKLYIYCDENDTPQEVKDHCGEGGCCNDEDGRSGAYVYVAQNEDSTIYAMVLCPNYFSTPSGQQKYSMINKDDKRAVSDIWSVYPNQGSMLLHAQLHLPFLSNSYVGDVKNYYNPYGSAALAFSDPERSSRTAENYAVAALAISQMYLFNLEEPPRWMERPKDFSKDPMPNPPSSTQASGTDQRTATDVPKGGAAGGANPAPQPPKFVPVPTNLPPDLGSRLGYEWLNVTLPKLPAPKELPVNLVEEQSKKKHPDPRVKNNKGT